MRRPLAILATAVAALVAPAAAPANFFPGDAIDGPSAEIVSIGELDLGRDGTGAIAYVKREGGVDHVFVSRFAGGRFATPERIDAALPGPSSQPVVGASDNGRLIVAFVNAGTVYGVVKPSASSPLSAPTPLGTGALPAADLSINGTGYVSFTSGGDVRVARLDRSSNLWTLLPAVVDANPAAAAGAGTGRSRVSVSADGVGVVVWGESGRVYARKMFNTGLSNAPQDLTVPTIAGRTSTVTDLPDVDSEDDSSYAWVAYRQSFADGGSRVFARRQRGTGFDPPVPVDAGDEAATDPRIEISGRGVGLASAAGVGTFQPMAAVLEDDKLGAGGRVAGPGTASPVAALAMAENNRGLLAAVVSPAGGAPFVRVRPFDDGRPQAEVVVSRPELGPVDAGAGFDAASDRAYSVAMAWIQGAGAERRLVAGYFDRPPLAFNGFTSQRCCRTPTPLLSWQPAFELWGPIRYQVLVDGVVVGETAETRFQLPQPLDGPTHRWQVRAIDVRGQQKRSTTRRLRIDDLRPRQTIRYRRSGRTVTVSVRSRDPKRKGHRASGVSVVRVSWGDRTRGARSSSKSRGRLSARHRYRRSGRYSLVITTRDKAGNENVNRRSVRIGG